VNLRFFGDVLCYNILSASKFVNELLRKDREKFDVVCVHDWLSAIAGLIIKSEEKELPVIFHVHSTEQLRTLGQGSRVVRDFEKEMAEKADRIVTVSYAMRDHLISLGYPSEKIRVCWNGCDPEKYDPSKISSEKIWALKEKYGIQPDEKVVLFIGRLTWIKGVQNLLNSFPSVLRDYPKTKLVILGKGEDYTDLQRLTCRLNIRENVEFRSEWVTEEERILHYAMADLCVFPSIHEPFGIVSLEAMSMKNPLVVGASGVSGFREQVIPSGPDQCGVHVDARNPADIAWGIKEVLKDPERARQWGENGRKRVLQFFTWDKVAEDTISIYEETLKS
jgi:glycosyltransferase involved in cell wall biosynthesis